MIILLIRINWYLYIIKHHYYSLNSLFNLIIDFGIIDLGIIDFGIFSVVLIINLIY